MRARKPWPLVNERLLAFAAGFPAAERVAADPVQLAHAHDSPADQEVAAFVASCLAFGRASSIVAKARTALEPLGRHPAEAAAKLGAGEVPPHLATWSHRWVRGADVAWLLAAAGRLVRRDGSLGAAFRRGLSPAASERHLLPAMTAFAEDLHGLDPRPWVGPSPSLGQSSLLPIPRGQSAAKRLCLFLRWMVRPKDGVDLGLWPDIGTARLTMPLDTHVARIASYIGLTNRRTPGWLMAREITDNLARFDPEDPVRFDFALSHLGIMGGCPRRQHEVTCNRCDLVTICRL